MMLINGSKARGILRQRLSKKKLLVLHFSSTRGQKHAVDLLLHSVRREWITILCGHMRALIGQSQADELF